MNVTLSKLSKRFGQLQANDAVSLEIRSGEVLGLLGENGAGKSTLMKLLYGIEKPDSGDIHVEGERVRISSPRQAQSLGIGMVFQQFSLIGALSVTDNLLLGARGMPFFLRKNMPARLQAEGLLRKLAPEIVPARRVSELGAGEKQLVELTKVLWRGARLLILDEPTSVLARPEAERLWQRVRALAAEGHSVVLITHKLEDVARCADRAVVLRAGKVVLETTRVNDEPALISAMLGEALPAPHARRRSLGNETRLRARDVVVEGAEQRVERLCLEVARGQVLGIAGVTGNGQELLGRVLAGVVAPHTGSIELDGRRLEGAADARVAYLPEQPLQNAVAPALPVWLNLSALEVRRMPWRLELGEPRRRAAALLERFQVRPRDLDRPAGGLSGGNVQKLVAARELHGEPLLIVACFPTMGLDVAAGLALVGELLRHAERGASVVWISEDLDLLLEYADEVGVLYRGSLRGPIPVSQASKARLGSWMGGAAA